MLSQPYDFDLLCIGSEPAGQRAAIQAAKLGKRAALVERRRATRGVCAETAAIPSKTFREAVLSFNSVARRYEQHVGYRYHGRAKAEELLARVEEVMRGEMQIAADRMRRNNVAMFHGDAAFHDPHTVMVTTEDGAHLLTAANILIAVGTAPALVDGVEFDGEFILSSDDVPRLKRLPQQMAVVGGGIIGVEYASMLAALNSIVTVIDKRTRLLEFLDSEIVDELTYQMRNRHVTFRLGEAVERLELTDGTPRRVVLTLESGKRVISDSVLYATSRLGATYSLSLTAAGLTADKRGLLKVDSQFRTEVPHIFAIGDVIGDPRLAATSALQGRHVAYHAFGVDIEPESKHFPVDIYAIPDISMVGQSEHDLTRKRIPYETGVAHHYREVARGRTLGNDSGLVKLIFHREDRRLLGVHAIGTGATELVQIGQAVLDIGGGLDFFLRTVFSDPPLAECYKLAALHAHSKLAMTATCTRGKAV